MQSKCCRHHAISDPSKGLAEATTHLASAVTAALPHLLVPGALLGGEVVKPQPLGLGLDGGGSNTHGTSSRSAHGEGRALEEGGGGGGLQQPCRHQHSCETLSYSIRMFPFPLHHRSYNIPGSQTATRPLLPGLRKNHPEQRGTPGAEMSHSLIAKETPLPS